MNKRKTGVIWTTGDGRNIDIADMTTDHLLNTVKLLVRMYNTTTKYQVKLHCRTMFFPMIEELKLREPPRKHWRFHEVDNDSSDNDTYHTVESFSITS